MILSYLQAGIGALAGGVAVFGLLSVYNGLVENPRIRAETRAIVQAENAELTKKAIEEVSDDADKARAMRRYCLSIGKLYDFGTNRCREGNAIPHG